MRRVPAHRRTRRDAARRCSWRPRSGGPGRVGRRHSPGTWGRPLRPPPGEATGAGAEDRSARPRARGRPGPRVPCGAWSGAQASRDRRRKLRRTGANRVEPTSSSRRDQPYPSQGCGLAVSIYLLRYQVPPKKDRNRIAYLVQNHPEHGAASPLDLLAGPGQGVPPGRAGPGHENDAVAEHAREGTVGVSQDRRCIQKRIVVIRSLRVKPKCELLRTKERLLVRDRARARDDGESTTSPGRRRRHVLRAHELGEIGSARRETRGEAR